MNTGELSGDVLDVSGYRVAAVQVTATQTSTHAMFRATTGRQGHFLFPELPVGFYTLTAERAGLLIAESGAPFTVNLSTAAGNEPADVGLVNATTNVERPNVTGNPNAGAAHRGAMV